MSLLSILYWVLLVLWALGFVIETNGSIYVGYLHTGYLLALFVIIGLRSFRTPIA